MIKSIFIFLFLFFSTSLAFATEPTSIEITNDKAIEIAANAANSQGYNAKNSDVEVLKVKKGIERGPFRIVAISRFFPIETVLNNEFWVVYFYPKGQLEKPTILGGDFTALIDLHTGEVLDSFAGQ